MVVGLPIIPLPVALAGLSGDLRSILWERVIYNFGLAAFH